MPTALRPITLRPVDEPVQPIPKAGAHKKPASDEHSEAPPARIGDLYTLRGEGHYLQFVLKSVELSEGRVRLGDHDNEVPQANEKLLLVHFTLRNPAPIDIPVDGDTVRMYAYAADKKIYQDVTNAVNEDTDELIDGTLPARTQINVLKIIHVPARGPVLYLRVAPAPADMEPFHFPMIDHVAKLTAPYADPGDPTGMTALEPTPAQLGDTYAVGDFDVMLEKAQFTEQPMLSDAGMMGPLTGYHFAVFTFSVTCQNDVGEAFNIGEFNPALTTADGLQIDPAAGPLVQADQDQPFDTDLQYGDTRHFRIYYPANKHVTLSTLTIQAGPTSHQFSYDLTALLPGS